jgi:hypothetical protein
MTDRGECLLPGKSWSEARILGLGYYAPQPGSKRSFSGLGDGAQRPDDVRRMATSEPAIANLARLDHDLQSCRQQCSPWSDDCLESALGNPCNLHLRDENSI